ncbi:permease [Heliobacterium undosum]|uniref:Permease n=1 Tax=Heliomicrobium undosum TaxID=121734 RepID=A0A845L2U9_9FIRM|nr:permease [Heliomicrobium undosum]MZP30016.1 permease [Heliomicrobium undosum]
MTTIVLYTIALCLAALSWRKDKSKTMVALRKAWTSFLKLLPDVLVIMLLVGISLAVLKPEIISRFIGDSSGLYGIIVALLVGSITMVPSFVAFPLAAALLQGGAGYTQVAAFVSTLMAVGIITLPAEVKYFNKPIALLRNAFAFIIAVLFTIVIGWVM